MILKRKTGTQFFVRIFCRNKKFVIGYETSRVECLRSIFINSVWYIYKCYNVNEMNESHYSRTNFSSKIKKIKITEIVILHYEKSYNDEFTYL